jgi:hypothetical protein
MGTIRGKMLVAVGLIELVRLGPYRGVEGVRDPLGQWIETDGGFWHG